MKIAVFAKSEKDFNEIKCPRNGVLIRINSCNDIHGNLFDAIITMYRWYNCPKRYEAYQLLRLRQVELFTDKVVCASKEEIKTKVIKPHIIPLIIAYIVGVIVGIISYILYIN